MARLIDYFVWMISADYPGLVNSSDDERIAMRTVIYKLMDGVNWMGQFDAWPYAPRSLDDALNNTAPRYYAQSIGFAPWVVPHGIAWQAEADAYAEIAKAFSVVLIDVEPFAGFWNGDLDNIPRFFERLADRAQGRAIVPILDTRVFNTPGGAHVDRFAEVRFDQWAHLVNFVWSMDYFNVSDTFGATPAEAVKRSSNEIRARGKQAVHILPGDAQTSELLQAVRQCDELGENYTIWRRGIISLEAVDALIEYESAPAPQPPPPPGPPPPPPPPPGVTPPPGPPPPAPTPTPIPPLPEPGPPPEVPPPGVLPIPPEPPTDIPEEILALPAWHEFIDAWQNLTSKLRALLWDIESRAGW